MIASSAPETVTIIPGADVATFQDLMLECFGKDNNHVYHFNRVLPWGDPATFQMLWSNESSIFFRNGDQIVAASNEIGYSPGTGAISPSNESDPMGTKDFVVPNGDQVRCKSSLVIQVTRPP